jgi:SAM-dependent methyltransferase
MFFNPSDIKCSHIQHWKIPTMSMQRLELLSTSWSTAAVGYNNAFVPRFAPWTKDVLNALAKELASIKTIVEQDHHPCCCVPCCGPGQELLPLSRILGPNWSVVGVDFAPGMIEVAQQRLAQLPSGQQRSKVQAVLGDCSSSLPLVPGNGYHDVIVSVFGFQQMYDPVASLQVWLDSLTPETGRLVICFWPSSVEEFEDDPPSDDDPPLARPFTKWREGLQKCLPDHLQAVSAAHDKNKVAWDDVVVQKAGEMGATVVQDEYVAHDLEWSSADEFWEAMTQSGPWHSMRLKQGNDFVDSLKQEVCASFEGTGGPLVHRACA